MQNTNNDSDGEINIFGKGDRGVGTTDSDSICRANGILRTNIHLQSLEEIKSPNNIIKYSTEITTLIFLTSYRATQLLIYISGN